MTSDGAVKYSIVLSVALPDHDRAKLVDLYQTLIQRDEEIERLRAALQKFVDHYPHGINPFLDETYSMAREALTDRLENK